MTTPQTRLTRRGWLLVGGTALTGLAGCSALRTRLGSDDHSLSFDPAELSGLGERAVPTPPATVPVAVPPAQFEHHRTRARELLDTVPEHPDLPNEAMAAEIAATRESTVEAITEEERGDPPRNDRERLDAWRYHRYRAAEVRGAFRAATGALDAATFKSRRSALRADRDAFVADWNYRGPDPITTLVVHRELEALDDELRDGADAWPSFPSDPRDAVFRVGELVATIERSHAALEDAVALRDRFLDGATALQSYRSTLGGAAHRLNRDFRFTSRRHHEYIDRADPPFERDVTDTPAAELYRRVRAPVDGRDRLLDRSIHRGHLASAVLQAGIGLTQLETLESVAEAIEAGRYGSPTTANRVRRERGRAVAALEHAWTHEPQALSRALTVPALDALQNAAYAFDRGSQGQSEVFHIYADFAHARHYAGLVPAATDHVAAALHEASPD